MCPQALAPGGLGPWGQRESLCFLVTGMDWDVELKGQNPHRGRGNAVCDSWGSEYEYAKKRLSKGERAPGREEQEGMCLVTSTFEHFTESVHYEIKNEKKNHK